MGSIAERENCGREVAVAMTTIMHEAVTPDHCGFKEGPRSEEQ